MFLISSFISLVACSEYKLNRGGDNEQPCLTHPLMLASPCSPCIFTTAF